MSGLRERPPRPAAPHTWAPAMQRTRCGGLGATGPSLGAREPPGRRLGPRGAGPLRQEPPPGPGPGPSDGRLVGLINAAGRGGVTAVNKQIGKPQARDSAAPAAHAVWSGSFHDPSAPRRRRALFLMPGAPRLCPPGRRGSREGRAPRTSGELTSKGGVSTATGPAGCSARTTAGAPGHPRPPPAAPGHPAVAGEHK